MLQVQGGGVWLGVSVSIHRVDSFVAGGMRYIQSIFWRGCNTGSRFCELDFERRGRGESCWFFYACGRHRGRGYSRKRFPDFGDKYLDTNPNFSWCWPFFYPFIHVRTDKTHIKRLSIPNLDTYIVIKIVYIFIYIIVEDILLQQKASSLDFYKILFKGV